MKSLLLTASLALAAATTAQSPIVTTMVGGLVLTPATPANGANTIFFDVNVTNPNGMIVQSFDLNTQLAAGFTLPSTATFYVTAVGGTQTGNRANPAAWTQVSTATLTTAGAAVATLQTPFVLATGTYGMAIHMTNLQAVYTNPATPVPPLPTSFSNADVTINCVDARIQNSTPTAPFSGGASAVRTPNLRMYYSTTTLVNGFTATPTSGNVPLAVQFTNTAFSSAPGGILAYSWDFDGDNIADSTSPNPQHVYTTCGTYTVSLTVADANGSLTDTKTNYIVVDPLTANFTWTKIGNPAVYQFNYTGSTSALTYAWDLDGDTVVDSTQPNPVFAYLAGCTPIPVTLSTTNNCRSSAVTKQFVPLPTATTLFNSNNSGATGWGNFFDVNVTNPDGVSMCALSMNLTGNAGVPFTATVYTTPVTYVGNDANAAVWTLVGTGTGTTGGLNLPSTASFPTVYLAPGSYGFAVYVTGAGPAYSGTGSSPLPGATSYSNGDMTLTLGISRNGLFGAAANVYTPRIWNGSIHYETVDQGLAIYQVFGAGCAGSLGVPQNQLVSLPKIGQTLSANFTNLPTNVAVHMLGFSRTVSNFGPLPVSLAPFGAPGCSGHVSADAVSLMLGVGNTANFAWTLPNDPSFLGARFYNQALALDPSANPLGAVTSNAAMIVLGQ